MSASGIHLLRWALAIVYRCFGGLKLINASPAAERVGRSVFWLPPDLARPFIGGWEVLIGLGLLWAHPLSLRATHDGGGYERRERFGGWPSSRRRRFSR
jgi:hypothetical protein